MIQQSFTTTTTETTGEKIWKLMSDVNNWETWDDTIDHAELQGQFESGSQYILKPKGGPTVKIRLTDVQPRKYFKDLTAFPLAKMVGEHWFEDTENGLKITTRMTMTGMLAPLWNRLVMKNIVAHLEEDIRSQITASKKL